MHSSQLLADDATFWYHALVKQTRNTYEVGVRKYLRFCAQCHVCPFPLREAVLEMFATFLARAVGYRSIKTYLQGVQAHNFDLGFTQPLVFFPRLTFLLRGIRRCLGAKHTRSVRVPVSLGGVARVVEFVWRSMSTFDAAMLTAALLTAFFGMLWSSEYCSPSPRSFSTRATLLREDLSLDRHKCLALIHIKISKTDPFMSGVRVRIAATGCTLCPYRALRLFLRFRGHARGPLFVFADGSFLTRDFVAALLKRALPEINVNTHSLRRGGASALAASGHSAYTIQLLGRWYSSAFTRYIEFDDAFVRAAQRGMSSAGSALM